MHQQRALIVAVLWAAVPAAGAAQAAGAVRGRILNAVSLTPVPWAQVSLDGTRHQVTTDLGGRFLLDRVAPGTYRLAARTPGFEPLAREALTVVAGETTELDLLLQPLPVRLQDVVVSPGTFGFVEPGLAARHVMSRADIQEVPQFGEDIFRTVTRLPGLASSDFTAGFSIRGGRRDETLILLDGLEIYEPYHLKDFNEGAVSIVDVETIDGVQLMTGGFPARYGNRTAGVFRIDTRDGRGEATRASLGLSFINARAMAQGSFAGERGSWLLSGRRGYLDLMLGLLNITDIPRPSYHDAFGKVRYDLSPTQSLTLHSLTAGDRYTLDGLATTGFEDSIPTREVATNRYGNSYVWSTLRSSFGRLGITTLASAGLVTTRRDGSEFHRTAPDTMYAIVNRRDFDLLGLRQEWRLDVHDRVLLEAGGEIRRFSATYDLANRVWQDPDDPVRDTTGFFPQDTRLAERRDGTTLSAWVGGRAQPLPPLTVELGLRYDRVSYSGDRDWSPRAGSVLRLGERTRLRLGWGYYRQAQGVAELAALDGLGQYFRSELSRQWTAGVEHTLPDGGELRVEAYDRRGSRLRPAFRNWKGVIDVFPEVDDDRFLAFPLSSRARGIELLHARTLGRRWSVRVSYALSHAEEEVVRVDPVNDPFPLTFDRIHAAPQDQRHAVNLDLTYRPSTRWAMHLAYAFHTGWPATLEVTEPGGAAGSTIRPGRLYGGRLPAYHRLDVRFTRRGNALRLYFEILNLTNRTNVAGYDYYRVRDASGAVVVQRDAETWATILPSIGVSWSRTF